MYPLNLYEQGEQVESDGHMLGPQPGMLGSLFVKLLSFQDTTQLSLLQSSLTCPGCLISLLCTHKAIWTSLDYSTQHTFL